MSTTSDQPRHEARHEAQPESSPVKQGFAAGTTVAAAVILGVAGVISVLQGIAAIAADELFVTGLEYTYAFDVTGWGWVHLIVGALVVVTAFALLTGATWARIAAVTLAGLSIIANFLWLPYYPLWAILVIALDIVVIWAIATWDSREI
ncbi:hypothetical protein [Rhodococcus sp. HNM0569]|uniref:DUF7144 family membrane protein n=1 Tax=Rhodococcus sp. HNM0569 TaxID=2716340 RepID=UPI00146A277D|nr:hypothetical protein [Rhodococcus sp. HNM0569]NLU84686.1 hypothetical protein [Rhodococcus sp. HNM0569]